MRKCKTIRKDTREKEREERKKRGRREKEEREKRGRREGEERDFIIMMAVSVKTFCFVNFPHFHSFIRRRTD